MSGMFLPGTFHHSSVPGRLGVCRTCNVGAVVRDFSRGKCANLHRDLQPVRYGESATYRCPGCAGQVTVDSYNPADLSRRGQVYCDNCQTAE